MFIKLIIIVLVCSLVWFNDGEQVEYNNQIVSNNHNVKSINFNLANRMLVTDQYLLIVGNHRGMIRIP